MTALTHSRLYEPFQPTVSPLGLSHYRLALQQKAASGVLSALVYRFIKISAAQATEYPVIPDATHALYFSPNCCLLSVGLSQPTLLQLAQGGDYYGIHFYPGALEQFFARNFSEIGNRVVDAHYLPGALIDALQDIFYQTWSFAEKIRRCEALLAAALRRRAQSKNSVILAAAMTRIYQARGTLRIKELAASCGYSERHLSRLFQHSLGMSGKMFAGVIRMQYLYREIRGGSGKPLANYLNYGFYDQSHFIKDFKRLIGTPAF